MWRCDGINPAIVPSRSSSSLSITIISFLLYFSNNRYILSFLLDMVMQHNCSNNYKELSLQRVWGHPFQYIERTFRIPKHLSKIFRNEEYVWLNISFTPWTYPYSYISVNDICILRVGQNILPCLHIPTLLHPASPILFALSVRF